MRLTSRSSRASFISLAGAFDMEYLVDNPACSQGFFLLINVAVGAVYARCIYRHIIRKVAVIDFDVHHVSGTEAIVRRLQWRQRRGQVSSEVVNGVTARIVTEAPLTCKPWLDPETDAE